LGGFFLAELGAGWWRLWVFGALGAVIANLFNLYGDLLWVLVTLGLKFVVALPSIGM
jgi:hypothetical protein